MPGNQVSEGEDLMLRLLHCLTLTISTGHLLREGGEGGREGVGEGGREGGSGGGREGREGGRGGRERRRGERESLSNTHLSHTHHCHMHTLMQVRSWCKK